MNRNLENLENLENPENVPHFLRVDISAAHHAHDSSCRRAGRAASWRRSSDAAPAPSARLCVARNASRTPSASSSSLSVTMSSSSRFEDLERQVEGDARRHAFGEGVGRLADDARPVLPRSRERVGALRLDADHLGAAAEPVRTMRAAARAAAAADRHEDDVGVRLLLEDLERVGRRRRRSAAARSRSGCSAGRVRAAAARPARALRRSRGRTRSARRRSARIAAFFSGLLPSGDDDRARHAFAAGTPARSTARDCRSSP